jgi:valyl-tRNA synthetase
LEQGLEQGLQEPGREPRPWPGGDGPGAGDPLVLAAAAEVLAAVRGAKSRARMSMRAPVARVAVHFEPGRLAAVRAAARDLRAAGGIGRLDLVETVAGEASESGERIEVELSAT